MLDDGAIYVHKLRWKICLENKAAVLVRQNCKGLVKESVLCYVNGENKAQCLEISWSGKWSGIVMTINLYLSLS